MRPSQNNEKLRINESFIEALGLAGGGLDCTVCTQKEAVMSASDNKRQQLDNADIMPF